MERPKLTFTPAVAKRVTREYERVATILEYGSGGSTVLAAKMGGKRVFSVETDPVWAAGMRAYLDAVHPDEAIILHNADIGLTGEWGLPLKYSKLNALKYLRYARSVWDRPDFEHPDLILIDGRFRISCLWTALERIKRPTRILFDDFANRSLYHRPVIEVLKPTAIVDRMGIFDVEPGQVRLRWTVARLRTELLP